MVRRRHRSTTVTRPYPSGRYGGAHKATRKRLDPIVQTGTVRCVRCGGFIRPGEPWHLDHRDDGRGWLGPAHARCNARAGWEKMTGRLSNGNGNGGGFPEHPYRWSRRWDDDPPVGTQVLLGGGLVEVYLGGGQWS